MCARFLIVIVRFCRQIVLPGVILGVQLLGISPHCAWANAPRPDTGKSRVQELERQLALAQAELATCNEALGIAVAEIASLKAESASTSSSLATCQADLQAAETRIQGLEVRGCTDPAADNYNVKANVEDGTCKFSGCTDAAAINFDQKANVDDGSCRFPSD